MEPFGGTSALEQLEILVGDWMMEVGPASQPPWPGEAWVTFEWLRDRAFLIQRWVVPAAFEGIAVIGPVSSREPSTDTTSTGAASTGSTR
jgi:hypothetical protein